MDTTIPIEFPSGKIIEVEVDIFNKGRYWFVVDRKSKVMGYSDENENGAVEDFIFSYSIFFKVHDERGKLDFVLDQIGYSDN